MYRNIIVETTDNKIYEREFSDYYVKDGFLTVFRDDVHVYDNTTFYKYHENFNMSIVKRIKVIDR